MLMTDKMSRIKFDISSPAHFGRLPKITEDEENMLDLAFNLQKTSRRGCRIIITDDLDGLTVTLPGETRGLLFSRCCGRDVV
jgi:2Fe-2S ferredoxin